MNPPRFLFLTINSSCNLRCLHCGYWRQREDPARLSVERMGELCDEMAELNPAARVVICGGEPLLELDRYFGVCQAARRAGLRVLSVVNGTRIQTPEDARRVLLEGPHEVSISLDDWRPSLHDELRGVPGAFARARRAIELLVNAKRELGADDSRVNVMALIHARNYETLGPFFELRAELGADKLKLNIIQPSFGTSGRDPFWKEYGAIDAGRLGAELHRLDCAYPFGLNPDFAAAAEDYCRAIGRVDREAGWSAPVATSTQLCDSFDRNIMVDTTGTARLCFATGFPGWRLERRGDLRAFWKGATWRDRMRTCRRACGISHSVRRMSATRPA